MKRSPVVVVPTVFPPPEKNDWSQRNSPRVNIKRMHRGAKEKSCYLKFINERDFLHWVWLSFDSENYWDTDVYMCVWCVRPIFKLVLKSASRLLPTFRGRKKIRYFFYLTKLNSNIQPNVSIKRFSEIFKSTRFIEKNVFSNKSL